MNLKELIAANYKPDYSADALGWTNNYRREPVGWIDSEKKSLEYSIKFTTKGVLSQVGLLIFNAAGMAYNGYGISHDNLGWISGFGLGAFASNFLWTLCMVCKWWGDIRSDKAVLKYIRELELKEKLHEDKEAYKKSKTLYDDALASKPKSPYEVGVTTLGAGGWGTDKPEMGAAQKAESKVSGHVCKKSDLRESN